MTDRWEPTRWGGLRRVTSPGSSDPQSTTQMKWRSERRKLPRVLEWNRPLGLPDCPYVYRWKLEIPKLGSIRLHHWIGPDDDRAFHDHPWWFLTFVIRGGYEDHNPGGIDHLRAPAVRFRHAEHRHTVHPDLGGAWTVVVTGRRIRAWGFWPGGSTFMHAS